MTYIVAIHDISDQEFFWEKAPGEGPAEFPEGITLHATYPHIDGSRAICLWEADSLETVRDLVDGMAPGASRNQYFETDPQHAGARGLPALGAVSA